MTRATLLALADRVEALTGPCRETDAAVDIAVFPDRHALVDLARGQMSSWWAMLNNITRYTASIDAAVALLDGRDWSMAADCDGATATVIDSEPWHGHTATPALALTAAALMAIAAQEPT